MRTILLSSPAVRSRCLPFTEFFFARAKLRVSEIEQKDMVCIKNHEAPLSLPGISRGTVSLPRKRDSESPFF